MFADIKISIFGGGIKINIISIWELKHLMEVQNLMEKWILSIPFIVSIYNHAMVYDISTTS